MYDGASFKLTHVANGTGTPQLELDGKVLPACAGAAKSGCYETVGAKLIRAHLGSIQKGTLKGTGRFTIEISSLPRARKVAVDVHY